MFIRKMLKLHDTYFLGFTISEILIALAVVGVVAALTFPGVVAKQKEREYMTKIEKVYSTLANALALSQSEYAESIEDTFTNHIYENLEDAATHQRFRDYLGKNMFISEVGNVPNNAFIYYSNISGSNTYSGMKDSNSFASMRDNSGNLYFFRALPNYCNSNFGSFTGSVSCGNIIVDVSGLPLTNKKIRRAGVNVFAFDVTKNGVKPGGYEKIMTSDSSGMCTGLDCTAWVVHYKNMDYLHCSDLSWNGKHACK